jgi:hypothetical protein
MAYTELERMWNEYAVLDTVFVGHRKAIKYIQSD